METKKLEVSEKVEKWAYVARWLAENDLPVPRWLDFKLSKENSVCMSCYHPMTHTQWGLDTRYFYWYCHNCDGQ